MSNLGVPHRSPPNNHLDAGAPNPDTAWMWRLDVEVGSMMEVTPLGGSDGMTRTRSGGEDSLHFLLGH